MPKKTTQTISQPKKPELISAARGWSPAEKLRVAPAEGSMDTATLCEADPGVVISGPEEFPLTMLTFPLAGSLDDGIDPATVRLFRIDGATKRFVPIWSSGLNVTQGFVWAKIQRSGRYVAIGLPRDRMFRELLCRLAKHRRYSDGTTGHKLTKEMLVDVWLAVPDKELTPLRTSLAQLETATSLAVSGRLKGRGREAAYPLPGGSDSFRSRLERLETGAEGLPEEQLVFKPESALDHSNPPWPISPQQAPTWRNTLKQNTNLNSQVEMLKGLNLPIRFPIPCWIFSQDWWMFHANEIHDGNASGCSSISSTTINEVVLWRTVQLDGSSGQLIYVGPAIVGGKIYIGTWSGGGTANFYKIDLETGDIEKTFPIPQNTGGPGNAGWGGGVGGTPAVVGGYVYFASTEGLVFCLDAGTLTQKWVTDVRNPDPGQNQPVNNSNPAIGCWPAPLVVNGKVYVGVGLGEGGGGPDAAFGFVYCLDASSGKVIWLWCTNQFEDGVDNAPNDIPNSLLMSDPPAPFTRHASDPPVRGASAWSSIAYHAALNRVYFGTGNPNPDGPLPTGPAPAKLYSTGLVSLDADTGQFHGFFQPVVTDSYRSGDEDVDMPSGPVLFVRNDKWVIGIGNKNGSFFLVDPATMNCMARQQLLPYYNNDITKPIPTVDPDAVGGPGENHSGVYGSAAVHYGSGTLFVGLGGWEGGGTGGGMDGTTTPFVRAIKWDTLTEQWPTAVSPDNVPRYTVGTPPLYQVESEGGQSSPTVVNDLVLVTTSLPALYAFEAATGVHHWTAPGIPVTGDYMCGASVYGDYIVVGARSTVYIYTRVYWRVIVPPFGSGKVPYIGPSPSWWPPFAIWPPPPPPPPWEYTGETG